MKRRLSVVWIGIAGALVASILSGVLLPNQPVGIKVSMTLSVAAVLLSFFAVPFFLIGLKSFKVELRRAYIILCIGISAVGLAQIQLPIINLVNDPFWFNSGAIALPYLVGVICIFWSMRILSRLLIIRSLWRSPLLALLVTVVISSGVALLPHVQISTDELSYHIALALSIWNSVFVIFATVLAFKIQKKIGASYTHAMSWLVLGLAVLSFAGLDYIISQLIAPTSSWYWDYSISLIPFIAGTLILVIAGYTFDEINAVARVSMTISTPEQPSRRTTLTLSPQQELEIVLYVANLVSNPTDIDLVLDDVRDITAKLQPGEAPSREDQQRLDHVYIKLEEYLVHRDTLRVFTEDELRDRITKRFNLYGPIRTTLWQKQPNNSQTE